MKYTEAQRILITAFDHTPQTRADYLRIEAEKSGHDLLVFYKEIEKAYEKLEKYVNSKEITTDQYLDENGDIFLNENGEEYYLRNIIQLTDGRQIDCENITELLEPIIDFGNYVMDMLKLWNKEREGTQQEGEEPANKVKAWIVYFERDVNKTDKSNFDQIFKKREWDKGKQVVTNDFYKFKAIDINKKCAVIYKKSLQKAIDILKGEAKKKAENLYLELK